MKIDNLINIGFTLTQATDITTFFKNVAYIADFENTDLLDEVIVPDAGLAISSMETLDATFKPSTQFYKDISDILTQKNNTSPNRSEVESVILFQKKTSDATWAEAFTRIFALNANYAQLCISSHEAGDIGEIASLCAAYNRLGEFQTSDADVLAKTSGNIAETLMNTSNNNVKLSYHTLATDNLAGAIMSVQASSNFGSNGDLYSTLTNITPQEYTDTQENNLKDLNTSFYTFVNPINGGGVNQYASKLYFVSKMAGGENAKRRRIRYFIDLMLKAKGLDFLKKKLTYQDSSGAILESMLSAVLIEASNNNLITKNEKNEPSFYLNVLSMQETKINYNSLYLSQTYKVKGWYVDALTGAKIDIELSIDPTDAEKTLIETI